VKDNQPTVLANTQRLLAPLLKHPPMVENVDHHGDRIEIRRLWRRSTSPEEVGFYGAMQVLAVEREVIPKGSGVKESREINYALCSLEPLEDAHANAAMRLCTYRGHWTIENKSHYRRDRTYDEDRNPTRNKNAARVMAAFKLLAIFLCETGAHRPANTRDKTLPEFHRFCSINGVDAAIDWFKARRNPLQA